MKNKIFLIIFLCFLTAVFNVYATDLRIDFINDCATSSVCSGNCLPTPVGVSSSDREYLYVSGHYTNLSKIVDNTSSKICGKDNLYIIGSYIIQPVPAGYSTLGYQAYVNKTSAVKGFSPTGIIISSERTSDGNGQAYGLGYLIDLGSSYNLINSVIEFDVKNHYSGITPAATMLLSLYGADKQLKAHIWLGSPAFTLNAPAIFNISLTNLDSTILQNRKIVFNQWVTDSDPNSTYDARANMTSTDLIGIRYISLMDGSHIYSFTNYAFKQFYSFNITDLDSTENNTLPSFNYSYNKNVCINDTTNTNNFNFSYVCSDNEGDTCYYSVAQTSVLDTISRINFDAGGFVVNIDPPTSTNTSFWNMNLTEIALWFLQKLNPQGTINNLVIADSTIFYNDQYQSECTLENAGISLSKITSYPNQYNVLINNGCSKPMNITLPDFSDSVSVRIYTNSIIFINNSQYTGVDYAEMVNRYLDPFGNKILNFTVTRNFTQENVTLYFNGTLVARNNTPSNMYKITVYINDTSHQYYYVFSANTGYKNDFVTLYQSPKYNVDWSNIKYLNLWSFYNAPIAYDDIFIYGIKQNFNWQTTFPITTSSLQTNTYYEYVLYVSDTAHKDYNQYNLYNIPISVSTKYCGDGLFTLDKPPQTDAERGSVKGFLFLLRAITSIGDPFGVQTIFNNVAGLFYIWLFFTILFHTFSFGYSLLKSSLVMFIYAASGIFGIVWLISSILLLALGVVLLMQEDNAV